MKNLPQSYFRHDASASQDARLLKLRAKHGYEGIGVYWHIIETLYLNDGVMDADAMRTLFERNADALEYCITVGLIVLKDDTVCSHRLNEEIAHRMEKSEKAKKSAAKRWRNPAKKSKDANALRTDMPTQSEGNANAMLGEERRGEEIKLKKLGKKATTTGPALPTPKQEVVDPPPVREQKTDDVIEQEFFDLAIAEGWCQDDHYSESKRTQLHQIGNDGRTEIMRKMRVCINARRSAGVSTRALAHKMYGEIVGLIQDRGLDATTLSPAELSKRSKFAHQEATGHDDAEDAENWN